MAKFNIGNEFTWCIALTLYWYFEKCFNINVLEYFFYHMEMKIFNYKSKWCNNLNLPEFPNLECMNRFYKWTHENKNKLSTMVLADCSQSIVVRMKSVVSFLVVALAVATNARKLMEILSLKKIRTVFCVWWLVQSEFSCSFSKLLSSESF